MPPRYIVCLQFTKKRFENGGGWGIEFGHTTKEFSDIDDARAHVRRICEKGVTVYIEDGVRTLEAWEMKDRGVERMVMVGK